MKKNIMPFNREVGPNDRENSYSIGDDFSLIDNPSIASTNDYPFKLDEIVAVICTKGNMKWCINLKSYVAQAPSITIVMPGQILQCEHVSEDFSGFSLIMSNQFANSLLADMQERLSLRLSFVDNPCLPLNSLEIESILDYYSLLKKTQRIEDPSIRKEIVKHLVLAFYYTTLIYHSRIFSDKVQRSKQGVLLDRFMNLVQENFREQRDVGFYADRLCLTPKYLSKVVKDGSGAPAGEWIDNYVALEAKALLKSTGMTIQQISDELHFPSQSFFGKYFKRVVGMAPKEYRRK